MSWFSRKEAEEKSDGELQVIHYNADSQGDNDTKVQVERELNERGWKGVKIEESQPTTWTFWRRR